MNDTTAAPLQRGLLARLGAQEDLNFLLTNRIPRIAATRLMGRIANIESPAFTRLALRLWQWFTPLDLSEAKHQRFTSIKDCFTRELKDGARPFDMRPDVFASPCDAIVGATGVVQRGQVYQAKGFPYSTAELFGPTQDASVFEGGRFITLRLTSAMYHRFHAPADGTVEHVTYLSGDTWNVNPVALKRVERLFCRNERAVVRMRLRGGQPVALVPVAAVLVASIRLHWLDVLLHIGLDLESKGANEMPCSAPHAKGQEMGWFEHGSTIIVFVPRGFELAEGIAHGAYIRAGQALLKIS
ncbi:archaetidylserine decarboxylase [Roseateles sp. DC23W]|uniref:phosphatidylserine decarboxylase n=1 Tax=Pelomonas dachongensis TaxID=3299029 RepID=A0ABW7ETG2_9BURK